MKTSIPIIVSVLFLFGCGQTVDNKSENKKETQEVSEKKGVVSENTSEEKEEEAEIIPSFQIKDLGENETGNPSSIVSLNFGEKTYKIATITGVATEITSKEFEEKDIPKNAYAACGAWWAGAGDYFYVVPSKNGVAVYQGWQDEGQEDTGYHWKKLKEYTN